MSLLFFFTASLLCLLVGAPTGHALDSSFTINTTVVQVGQPFTVTCQLGSPPSQAEYYVAIKRDDDDLVNYGFPCKVSLDTTNGRDRRVERGVNATAFSFNLLFISFTLLVTSRGSIRIPGISVNPHHYTDLTVLSLVANASTFQVSITPKTLDAHKYSCWVGGYIFRSLAITVVAQLPSVTFSVSISRPQVGVPLTATCNIGHFSPTATSNYSVAFYSKRDGLLGAYECEAGNSMLSVKKQAHISIASGQRTSFPAFDLTLTEAQDVKQEYWCAFEFSKEAAVNSSHWGTEPFVTFTSSSPTSGLANTRLGTCSLDNFTPEAGQPFSIQFFTTKGPASVNLLAVYTIKCKCL